MHKNFMLPQPKTLYQFFLYFLNGSLVFFAILLVFMQVIYPEPPIVGKYYQIKNQINNFDFEPNTSVYKGYIKPSITFFAIPYFSSKPGSLELINITFRSWVEQFSFSRIILFNDYSNETAFSQLYDQLKYHLFPTVIEIAPDIEKDEMGMFYVNDMFSFVFENSQTDIICFINPDSILHPGFSNQISYIYEYFNSKELQFSVIGRSCPFFSNITAINENNETLRLNTMFNQEYSNDFILISKRYIQVDIDEIPAFHYGMFRWDTWIPGWLSQTIPVVSLGNNCSLYHIEHSRIISESTLYKISENFEMASRNSDYTRTYRNSQYSINEYGLMNNSRKLAKFVQESFFDYDPSK